MQVDSPYLNTELQGFLLKYTRARTHAKGACIRQPSKGPAKTGCLVQVGLKYKVSFMWFQWFFCFLLPVSIVDFFGCLILDGSTGTG